MESELLLDFLCAKGIRISFGFQWLLVHKDKSGFWYTVRQRTVEMKRSRRLYEGRHLNSALWCLHQGEEYK